MNQQTDITAVILHKNAQEHLANALASVQWCNERLIIDDNSTENLESCARKYHASIVKRSLTRFDEQRNYGLSQTCTSWILFLDADEIVSEKLAQEIMKTISQTKKAAFFIKRIDMFLGKQLRFGETGNIRFIRLARKDAGLWTRPVHEVWDVRGEIGMLQQPLFHTPHASIAAFLEKINRYTTLETEYRKEHNERFSIWKLFCYPFGKFILNYFFKRGFLDGFQGFVMAWMMSLHSLMLRVKMYEHTT